MKVRRITSASSTSALGYVFLLMGFAALGLFVAALATGSHMATPLAIVLSACLAGSVVSFRGASRRLAQSDLLVEKTSPSSIFSKPLRREQIEGYLERYRGQPPMGVPQSTLTVLVGGDSTRRTDAMSSAPARLSA